MPNMIDNLCDLAYRGKIDEVMTAVEEEKALLTKADINGRLLIHWAALGGHNDLVEKLIAAGSPADPPDQTMMTPLILAASGGREKVVNTLITEGANVNAKNSEGHSALQYAASKNWKPICVALINANVNINIADDAEATPLHRAASKGNKAIVELLLDCGSALDINHTDKYGNTALHLACEEDRVEEAKLLVSHGADMLIKNRAQQTPLDLAPPRLAVQLKKLKDNPETP